MHSFRYPFLPLVNPHLADAERHAIEWACAVGLCAPGSVALERLTNVRLGELVARAYPRASEPGLRVCAEWLTWLFAYDDYCDETEVVQNPSLLVPLHARLLCVLDAAEGHGQAPESWEPPLVRALFAVHKQIREVGGNEVAIRMAKLVELHLVATRLQADNRARGVIPDLEAYRTLRRHSGAVYTCFELIEIVAESPLPPEVLEQESLVRLGDLANDIICFWNDLVSLHKEQGDGHNLVMVLAHHGGLSLPEALRRARSLHDEALRAFVTLADELDPEILEKAHRHLDGLRSCMQGNRDWSLRSQRYREPAQLAA